MAPPSLHGLNVVQSAQPDNHDLAVPFPDFSAHLDLWTNLAFESDDPLAPSHSKHRLTDDESDDAPLPPGLPNQEGHENAVVPPSASAAPQPSPFDFNTLLAGFGIDPLLMLTSPSVPPQQTHPAPSFAQLLALHAPHSSSYPVPSPPSAGAPVPSTAIAPPGESPTPKRSRTQKSSSVTDSSADVCEDATHSDASPHAMSPTEDKRRRNTAASARFRLKKKEREAALEHRAKELEDRVVELERECEALRRENGWLKGLVVGVTGAGAAQQQQAAAK